MAGNVFDLQPTPYDRVTPDDVVGLPFWKHDGQMSIIFDPWGSNKCAFTQHTTYHTSWVIPTFRNFIGEFCRKLNGNAEAVKVLESMVGRGLIETAMKTREFKPAVFDWKTVYVVGRGKSFDDKAIELLNKPRKYPAIFLNHAFMQPGVKPQDHDFCFTMDNRLMTIDGFLEADKPKNLIAFAAIDEIVQRSGFENIYGVSFWSQAPLNQFMQMVFPNLPAVNDVISSAIAVSHLIGINRAERAVFIGTDFSESDPDSPDLPEDSDDYLAKRQIYEDVAGNKAYSQTAWAIAASATTYQLFFTNYRMKTEIINACGRGLLGLLLCAQPVRKADWMKYEPFESVINRIENG